MSLVKAEKYLQEKGFLDHVIELEASTATVAEAAAALGVEEGMIAKTMSFLQGEQPKSILSVLNLYLSKKRFSHACYRFLQFSQRNILEK